mmetsp:Transcript_24488/g.58091  ORF Transcript_24488/g.58091 Transcript_24488/m.58091 type:complete len:1322 (+) Transcript_24488:125-4090(+)
MTMMITVQLLEALMSPSNDIRGQAETVYNSITPVQTRVEGLMKTLMEFVQQQPHQQTQQSTTLIAFLSILLRRDILKLDQLSLLEQLVDPLLQCFVETTSTQQQQQQQTQQTQSQTQQQVQNGIGHCLAEICASLSVLPVVAASVSGGGAGTAAAGSSTSATTAVSKIVQQVEPMISSSSNSNSSSSNNSSSAVIAALSLLSMVADRSPVAFTNVVTPTQISQVVQMVTTQQQQSQQQQLQNSWKLSEVCFRFVVSSAVASTIQTVSLINSASQPNVEEIRLDDPTTSAKASQLATACLQPLINAWFMTLLQQQQQQPPQTQASVVEEFQQQCLQHLSHAALTVPSLLIGSAANNEGSTTVLHDVVKMVCSIITTTSSNNAWSSSSSLSLSAIQIVSNLCSVPDVRHKVLMKQPALVQTICQQTVQVCIQSMVPNDGDEEDEGEELIELIVDEPANLLDSSSSECTSANERISTAQSLLESLLSSLASPSLAVALPLAQQLLTNNNGSTSKWENVWAGLTVLETAVVAAPYALSQHVNDLIQAGCSHGSSSSISGGSNNNNNKNNGAIVVQYQALRLLATLCEVPVEAVTNAIRTPQFSRVLLEQFAAALTSPVTKLCAMGSTGIISFCQQSGGGGDGSVSIGQSLAPYLGHLLEALINGPLSNAGNDTGSITVRVRAMDATACLAAACVVDDDDEGEENGTVSFAPYYSTVMPGLIATAQLPQPDLATSALRSLAIVGSAVGNDLFQEDAKQVLSWILPFLASATEGGVSTEEVLTATARIASVLKDEFTPYINSVLPTILRIAQESNDVSFLEGNESGVSSSSSNGRPQDGESMTIALPGKGFTKLTINTYKIQEKASNNRVLYELAKATCANLGPHVPILLDVIIPLINFPYSSDVRSTAAQATSALFESVCAYGADMCGGDMQCPRHYLPLLSEAISRQISQEDSSDKDVLYGSADSLSEIFYITHDKFKQFRPIILGDFSLQNAQEVVQRCIKTLVDCLNRRSTVTRMLQASLTGMDEKEEFESQLQAEDGLLTPLTDSTGYLLKFFGQSFLPLFDKYIVPVLSQYILSTADVRASTAAFCLFDDCVEYCGPEAAAKYTPVLLPGVVKVLQNPEGFDVDLVQASVYGVSQMARYAPPHLLASSIHTIVQQLMLLTQGHKEDSPAGAYLYEISISALSSLVLWGSFSNMKGLNAASIQDRFLASLPIQQNDDEAKICHSQLCNLIENGSINIQVEAFRLTQIISAILFDVEEGEDVATQDTCSQLASILFQLQQGNPQMVQKAYVGLDADVQRVVGAVLQGHVVHSRSTANIVTPEK